MWRLSGVRRPSCARLAGWAAFAAALASGLGFLAFLVMVRYDVPFRIQGRYEKNLLFSGRPFAMSPDGTAILFAAVSRRRFRIVQLDTATDAERVLVASTDYQGNPAFSPDGGLVAFTRETAKCSHIWLMKSDGTQQRQLTFGPDYDSDPIFTADGHALWFSRTDRGASANLGRIYVVALEGTKVSRLDRDDPHAGQEASFAKDGAWVYYLGNDPFDASGCQIWRMAPDLTRRQPLGAGSHPAVSPDGTRVAFVSGNGDTELWVMRADGTERQRVYASRTYIRCVRFDVRRGRLVFMEETPHGAFISSVRLAGDGYRRLARLP